MTDPIPPRGSAAPPATSQPPATAAPSSAAAPTPAPPLGRFILLCLGVWLHSADTLVTATIAPAIVGELGGVAYINWTISLYEVGAIIAGAAVAALCARYGIKRVFTTATLLYGSGCLIGAIAPNMGLLISARLIQGMGGGMLLSLCYVAVEAWYPPGQWGRLFGMVALLWGAGSLLGPLIGGVFGGPHAWRGAFWLFAAQAVVLSLLSAFAFPSDAPRRSATAPESLATPPNPPPPPGASDAPLGAAAHDVSAETPASAVGGPPSGRSLWSRWPVTPLLVLSIATLFIAQAGVLDNGTWAIVSGLAGTALLYVAARLDRTARVRLASPQLLDGTHPVGAGLAMVFMFCVATTGFWAYGPLLLNILFGTRPLVTGYILAGEALAWSLATLAVAHATPNADRWLIRSGALGIAAGSAGFTLAVPSGSLLGIIGCGLLQGAGFGFCWPAVVQRVVRSAGAGQQSLASASVSTVQRIGYAVGTAAVGIAANLSGLAEGATIPAAKAAGVWVFASFIPVLLAGIVYAWRFTRRGAAPQ